MRVTSTTRGREHHVTIPAHKELKVGTLGQTLADVASYLERRAKKLPNDCLPDAVVLTYLELTTFSRPG
jgi:hypothetical protein